MATGQRVSPRSDNIPERSILLPTIPAPLSMANCLAANDLAGGRRLPATSSHRQRPNQQNPSCELHILPTKLWTRANTSCQVKHTNHISLVSTMKYWHTSLKEASEAFTEAFTSEDLQFDCRTGLVQFNGSPGAERNSL